MGECSGTVHTLDHQALGDKQVPNPAYSGPSGHHRSLQPEVRHSALWLRRNTKGTGSVTIGGVTCAGNWLESEGYHQGDCPVRAYRPARQRSTCAIQTRRGANATARCGQLVITAAQRQTVHRCHHCHDRRQGADLCHAERTRAAMRSRLAIDNATPGDLIMVGPGTYNEMLLMWKPVRLQGVGAGAVTINANTHPSGKTGSVAPPGELPVRSGTERQSAEPGVHARRSVHLWPTNSCLQLDHAGQRSIRCLSKASSAGIPRSTATSPSCCKNPH